MNAPLAPIADPAEPVRASVLNGPGVWMEGDAVAQLDGVAALAGCVCAVGMPDLHPGRGFPIGAVVATRGVVYPHLVGGDAGCGARVVVTDVAKVSADRLESRLRRAFAEPPLPDVDLTELFGAAWRGGPRGLLDVHGIPESLRALAAREPESDGLVPSGPTDAFEVVFGASLGSIGGGNHFAEITKVAKVVDEAAAASVGLARGSFVALVHSGSRGLGTALAAKWGHEALRGDAVDVYAAELAGACRFARANRLILAFRMLQAVGALRDCDVLGSFDVTHNDVRVERVAGTEAWVHRKGAAPAYEGALTVVLGSRGALSWVMRGTGSEVGLRSVAHGAGRRMGRSEAMGKIRARYKRAELSRSAIGGRLVCDDTDLLYQEHPDVYKAIDPVITALEAHGVATRVAALTPVVTVKL